MQVIKTFFHTLLRILRNLLIFVVVFVLLACLGLFFFIYRGTGNFMVEHGDLIREVAQEEGLDPFLVAGIVKSESDFVEDVVAEDGGVGLMQLMPDTVEWTAKRLGLDPKTLDLKDPKTNLTLGTHYLSYLVGRYQNEDLAIVAYNAGQSNVDTWLKEGTITWEYQSLNQIPNRIPRNYVSRVNYAQEVYTNFYWEGLPDSTTEENTWLLALKNTKRAIQHYLARH